MSNLQQVSAFLENDKVKEKFNNVLGKNSSAFLSSVLTVLSQNELLAKASKESVYSAALMSATLNLPINQNLGFAYIVPFKGQASFQLGYKGYLQLAQRSGQFKTISATPIYEGQIVSKNPLTGYEFDFENRESDKVIGYAAYFELLNGFNKTLYMSSEDITNHAKKYSQTFKKGFGVWKDNFESMAQKTVLKLLLSKYAPLSVEMQKAVVSDGAVINDVDTLDVDYIDNTTDSIDVIQNDQEVEEVRSYISKAKTKEDLDLLRPKAEQLGLLDELESKKL